MKSQVLADLEKARKYTLAVAESLPPDQYDFKPVNNVMTFAELMNHLAYSLIWMDENYFRHLKTQWQPPPTPKSKKQLLMYLERGFNTLSISIRKMNKWTKEEIKNFYFIIEHNAHHRGQAVTYLRCCNTNPPEFPF